MKKIPFDIEKARSGVPAYDQSGNEWVFVCNTRIDKHPIRMRQVNSGGLEEFTCMGKYTPLTNSWRDLHMREEEVQYKKIPFSPEKAEARTPAYDNNGDGWTFIGYDSDEDYPIIMARRRDGEKEAFTPKGKYYTDDGYSPMDLHMREEIKPETLVPAVDASQRADLAKVAMIALIQSSRFSAADTDRTANTAVAYADSLIKALAK